MSNLTVKDLKAAIANLPDDLPVLVSGGEDHGYMDPRDAARIPVGLQGGRIRRYVEWYGKKHASPGETEAEALVIIL